MSLDVYLHGKQVGRLFRAGGSGYRFAYRPEAVAQAGPDAILLSCALPVREEPFGPDASRAYVEGLLPQGNRRRAVARELGIDPDDGYGLIAELGGDCLGAVTFAREGEDPPGVAQRPRDSMSWLGEEELAEVLRAPPRRMFDPSRPRRMRFALPGKRHKLALVHDPERDRWAWPEPGVPSTHVVKPEAPERPGLVANEHACTIAYRELGVPVAHTSVQTIAGQTCLISKRFDRWGDGPGAERLHQESFAQALGIAPDCEERRLVRGTPSLCEASGLLRAIGEDEAVETLMRTTFCDQLIGCTELRGGNAALLFGGAGPMLAPFYDVASTEVYGEVRPRPVVVGDAPPAPLLLDLRHTIELCGLEFQPAIVESARLMGQLCKALGSVAADAWEEGWSRPAIDRAIQIVTARALGFRGEAAYLRPRRAEPPE